MPKRIFKITEFEGGENRIKDPRDLDLNECAQAKGVEFDKLGRIRVAGSGVEIKPLFTNNQNAISGGLHASNGFNDNISNFTKLIRERNNELIKSMDSETSTFPKELLI